MKLQRSVSRRLAGKEYVKCQVVLPNDAIERLGWNHGDNLEWNVTPRGRLLIYKVDRKQETEEPRYEQFKESVIRALIPLPRGCTWSELRLRSGLSQRTPSPIWVRRMEDERILERIRDQATSHVIWKLSLEGPVPPTLSTMNGWTKKGREADGND